MGYRLGIDIGAGTCAAAVRYGEAVEPCRLGEHGSTMPAVALPRIDGTTLVGEVADRRSVYEPTLVARMVSSRLDDPWPVVIDGTPQDLLMLTEALVGTVIERSWPAPGAAPDHVALTYPLRGGDAAEALLSEAAARATGTGATMVPEPIAAAARLARQRDLGDDAALAVVDFGASSVDVALVHRTPDAFDLVGDPASLPGFGGVDIDATMLALVESAIGDVTSMVDPDDRNRMRALRRLRSACRAAKERLSADEAAVVEVALPHARGRVEVTRDALERAVEASLSRAADLVLATIDDAGLIPADLRMVLLTGGSARIPRFVRLVAERTELPVVVDDAPELTTALGAALFADVAAPRRSPGAPALPARGAGADPTSPLPPASVVPQPDQADTGPNPLEGDPAADDWPDRQDWPDPHAAPAGGPWEPGPAAGTAWPRAEDPPAGGPWEPEPAAAWHDPHDPATNARWEPEPAAGTAWPEANRWDDERTSVFDPLVPPTPDGRDEEPAVEWGQTADEEFQRLRTSDTDPFVGRGASLAARRRERRQMPDDDEDDDGVPLDMRLILGGMVAAVIVVLLGAYALTSGSGASDESGIAVADTDVTDRTSTTEATTTTTRPTTTTTEATTTTAEPTTTSPPRRRPTPTTSPAPPPPPPTTAPPRPPTTRRPTTTTSTTSTTSTTTPPSTPPSTDPKS